MAFADEYKNQVALLLRSIPQIAPEECFALKGGTAINLFVREMPRLSVDIDLTFLPVLGYPESRAAIDAALKRVAERIKAAIPGSQVVESLKTGDNTTLYVRSDDARIVIEVTPVMRGCAFNPETRGVSKAVEEAFGFAEMKVLSFEDLYGGKIVAALDRQHPRDLFDVRHLLANEGISDGLRQAFIVYMLCHKRPMGEVLASAQKDIKERYEREFSGMVAETVSLEDLLAARVALIAEIVGQMPDAHKRFLISFERGEPDWTLLGVEGAEKLPAVKFRQLNLNTRTAEERADLVKTLAAALSIDG